MSRRQMVFYLFLNGLLSILVTTAVILVYDRNKPKTDCSTIETAPALGAGGLKVDILSISSPGDLERETVTIQNNGSSQVSLAGWMLKDSQGNTFNLPQVTLYPAGSIQVHTGSGEDSAAGLYWGLPEAVWKSGDLAALYDQQNIARAFYRIP